MGTKSARFFFIKVNITKSVGLQKLGTILENKVFSKLPVKKNLLLDVIHAIKENIFQKTFLQQ